MTPTSLRNRTWEDCTAARLVLTARRDRYQVMVGWLSVVAVMLPGMDFRLLLIGAGLLAAGLIVGLLLGRRLVAPAAARMADSTPAMVGALLAPATQALQRVEDRLREVERDRVGAYAGLREQVAALHRTSTELGAQARSLAGALRAPTVRGRWGEIQLQRIVELAGMVEHCDFDTQVAVDSIDGGVRPDMIIRLSGGRQIPVDSKVPFDAWLQAQEQVPDDRRRQLLTAHARALRAHVDALAAKQYWRHFQPAPEFVVMFVPGEPLLDAAMVIDPGLTEHAFARNVVIATPGTLISLLRTIAFTWRSETLSRSADEIHALGRDLHHRLGTVTAHLARLGSGLDRAVDSYNQAIGSFESRVLVTARRLRDMGAVTGDLAGPDQVVSRTRRPLADSDRNDQVNDQDNDSARPDDGGRDGPPIDDALWDDRYGAAGPADSGRSGLRDATVD